MITCISYGNILAMLKPKYINVAPLYTWVTCVTVFEGNFDTDYTGLNWSNINQLR